jgi:hypothetical protein
VRLVSNKSVGAAAILGGLVLELTYAWPTFGANTLTPVLNALLFMRAFALIFLGLAVAFGLWRLRSRGPGSALLMLSFALVCASAASFLVLLVLPSPKSPAQVPAVILLSCVPATITFASTMLLVSGLLRSKLVPAWVAGFVGVAAVIVIAGTFISTQALYASLGLRPQLPHPSALVLLMNKATPWLQVMSPIAIGLALVFRGRGGVVEQARQPVAPKVSIES